MAKELIEFWSRAPLDSAPYIHPDDTLHLQRSKKGTMCELPRSYDAFLSSRRFGKFEDDTFHFSLMPIPYGGNLIEADIFILLLNPSITISDYFAELSTVNYREYLERMLRQDFGNMDFPFIWLNPALSWTGGFAWWERKLRGVLLRIAEHHGWSYLAAMRSLANRLAHLELVPYRSWSAPNTSSLQRLPSSLQIRSFTTRHILDAAREGTKKVIVPRQASAWGMDNDTSVVSYDRHRARGASLGPTTLGGKAILARYGIVEGVGHDRGIVGAV